MNMDDPIPSSEPIYLHAIQRRVRELEQILENGRQDDVSGLSPSEFHALIRDCGLLLQTRVEPMVSECSDVGLLEDQDFEALERELNSVEAESTKVSNEIEGLIETQEKDYSRLNANLMQLKCSLEFVAEKDLGKANLGAEYGKDQLDLVIADKFELLELENQIEKKKKYLKSLTDLEYKFKCLDAAEQIEDAFTGLKVVALEENCIRLSLRTYIPNLENILIQTNIGDSLEPSEVNHELLIELQGGTMDIRNVEIFPNDVSINDILDAAKSLSKSSLQWLVTKLQDRIVLCTTRQLVVKSARKSRHNLEYLNREETIVTHVVGGVDAFIKVSQGWPLLTSPLKLINLKSSDQHAQGISLSFLCKVEELANSSGVQIRQNLSSFVDAIEKILVEQMHLQLHADASAK